MEPSAIVFPAIAMFFLTLALGIRMARMRVRAVARGEVDIGYYRLYNEGVEPAPLRLAGRHQQNLFEVPPLFYVVVLFLYVTGGVAPLSVGLAWLYFALRCVHSFVHLSTNDVPRRLLVFAASNAVLAALWIVLLVSLLRS